MMQPGTQHEREPAASVPAYIKVQRVCLAVCVIVAPLALSVWFVLCPQYGVPRCPDTSSSVFVAFHAVNPVLMQWFFLVTLVAAYLFPVSYIGLGVLAMKRSPWLATIGMACGLIGSFPWTAIVMSVILINTMVQMGGGATFLALLNNVSSSWPVLVLFIGWILGHLLGYVLLGIALGRARAVPIWATCLLSGGPFFQAVAYPTHQGILQVFGFVLVLVGSIPAALALLRTSRTLEGSNQARAPA